MTMVEPTLFDQPTTHGRVRASDPQTSLEAARSAPESKARQKALILAELVAGPRTAESMEDAVGAHRSVIRSRLAQMRGDGTVRVDSVVTGESGRPVQLWRLT